MLESFGIHMMLSRLSKLHVVNFSSKKKLKKNTTPVWIGTGRTWQTLWHQGMRRVLRDSPSPRSWATYVQPVFSCFLGSKKKKRPSFSPPKIPYFWRKKLYAKFLCLDSFNGEECLSLWLASGHSGNMSYGLAGVKPIGGVSRKPGGYWSFLEMLFSCRNFITPTSAGRAAWQDTSDPRGFWSAERITLDWRCWMSQKRGDSRLDLLLMNSLGCWRLVAALAAVTIRWWYVSP